MAPNGDRPLFAHVPPHQRGPLMNHFLEPVRKGMTTDPELVVKYVIATLKEDIQRRGTWNFHIPSDLVVDSWASSVESRSTLDFLYVPDE